MKAIELVRKAASVGASLARARGRGEGAQRGAVATAGRAVALRVVHATTVVAHRMQSLPIPRPGPAERVALSTAAAQLRAMAELADIGGAGDPEIEAALGALVTETLALVDGVLATDPELAGRSDRALPAATGDEGPTKVSF